MKKTIVVIQTAFLGDLLLGVPFYHHLRAQWPGHQLVLVCKKGLSQFFLKTECFDQVFEVEKSHSESYKKVLEKLNEFEIELLFCPHQSLRSFLFAKKIKAERKIGFKKPFLSWIFNCSVQYNKSWPEPLRQMSLLWALENENEKNEKKVHEISFYEKSAQGLLTPIPQAWTGTLKSKISNPQEIEKLFTRLGLSDVKKPMVALFPGSVWATKMWTQDGFIQLGKYLSEKYQVLIMGGKEEAELASRIAAEIPGSFQLAGATNIYESAMMLTRMKLVVANDSAASHLASLAETPVLTFFGPTVLKFGYRPWSSKAYIAELDGLACRPCGSHGPQKCPIGTHDCMKKIPLKNVLRQVDFILQNSPSHESHTS